MSSLFSVCFTTGEASGRISTYPAKRSASLKLWTPLVMMRGLMSSDVGDPVGYYEYDIYVYGT